MKNLGEKQFLFCPFALFFFLKKNQKKKRKKKKINEKKRETQFNNVFIQF